MKQIYFILILFIVLIIIYFLIYLKKNIKNKVKEHFQDISGPRCELNFIIDDNNYLSSINSINQISNGAPTRYHWRIIHNTNGDNFLIQNLSNNTYVSYVGAWRIKFIETDTQMFWKFEEEQLEGKHVIHL